MYNLCLQSGEASQWPCPQHDYYPQGTRFQFVIDGSCENTHRSWRSLGPYSCPLTLVTNPPSVEWHSQISGLPLSLKAVFYTSCVLVHAPCSIHSLCVCTHAYLCMRICTCVVCEPNWHCPLSSFQRKIKWLRFVTRQRLWKDGFSRLYFQRFFFFFYHLLRKTWWDLLIYFMHTNYYY